MNTKDGQSLVISAEKCREHVLSLIDRRDFTALREFTKFWEPYQFASLMAELPDEAEAVAFRILPKKQAAQAFEFLEVDDQIRLLHALGHREVASILDEMSPDDRTALLEELPTTIQQQLLERLDDDERAIARTLLGYPKGSIGRLMTPEYVALRRSMTVSEALDYIRRHARDSDTINVVYVLADDGQLLDSLRIRSLIIADPNQKLEAMIGQGDLSLFAGDPVETAVSAFQKVDLYALPVLSSTGEMLGIVTGDDVLAEAEERSTREMQMVGGSSELGEPYLEIKTVGMLWKRGPWLVILFLGGLFTANAMTGFEDAIEKAVVLTIFLPLIIASGGNSGSQAATLIIRAMGMGEVKLGDWWRVLGREILTGLLLGLILGIFGVIRVAAGAYFGEPLSPFWPMVGVTIGLSLVGVVLWGSVVGAMLPFVLRRCGLDPATSSAPFVSTFVDVTGIVIYFSIATVALKGTLL